MPGSLRERWVALRSVLTADPITRAVSRTDALRDTISWYGVNRRRIARKLQVRPDADGFVSVDTGRYRITWPSDADLSRLNTALVELWASSNSHYYFRHPTPVRAGDHVVDVGACEGAFALESLLRRGASRVWCFEPVPEMVAALRSTALHNGLTRRMVAVPAAVGAETGTCDLHINTSDPLRSHVLGEQPAAAGNGVRSATPVKLYALDDWVAEHAIERVDYLKIDAEGSDLDVLRGAAILLARWRPRIAVTTYHEPAHCNAMIEFLESLALGYRFRVSGVVSFAGIARPVMLHAAAD